MRQDEEEVEVQDSRPAPLPHLRQVARVFAEIRNVPHLLPRACAQGRNPGRDEGQLVRKIRKDNK
jgi:hypothetical protein